MARTQLPQSRTRRTPARVGRVWIRKRSWRVIGTHRPHFFALHRSRLDRSGEPGPQACDARKARRRGSHLQFSRAPHFHGRCAGRSAKRTCCMKLLRRSGRGGGSGCRLSLRRRRGRGGGRRFLFLRYFPMVVLPLGLPLGCLRGLGLRLGRGLSRGGGGLSRFLRPDRHRQGKRDDRSENDGVQISGIHSILLRLAGT